MAAALAVGLNVLLLHGQQDERLEQEVIASHARATLAQHLVDVESSNHHAVKPWLSARLDFSPPVQELSLPPVKIHCSVLAEDAIKAAINDYRVKNGMEAIKFEESVIH